MKHFYTTELGKYAGKKIFTSEPHMSALFHVMRQLMWKNIQWNEQNWSYYSNYSEYYGSKNRAEAPLATGKAHENNNEDY